MLSTKTHTDMLNTQSYTKCQGCAANYLLFILYPVRKWLLTLDLLSTMLIWLWQNARKHGVDSMIVNKQGFWGGKQASCHISLTNLSVKAFAACCHVRVGTNRQSGDAIMKGTEICLSSKVCTCRKWGIFLQALGSHIMTIFWWWIFLTGAVAYISVLVYNTIVWSILARH